MTSHSDSYSANRMSWIRRGITYVVVLLIGFMIGFVPMWLSARASAKMASEATARADLVRAQDALDSAGVARQLGLAEMQNTLASAAIDTQRGDYESARQATSAFFTSLREETNKGADSILSEDQKAEAESLFAGRDALISLLARSDPAAADRLSDVYVSFREIVSD